MHFAVSVRIEINEKNAENAALFHAKFYEQSCDASHYYIAIVLFEFTS